MNRYEGAEVMPVALAQLKQRDLGKIAREVFHRLPYLGPVHVPPPFQKSPALAEAIKAWNFGGTIPETLVAEFTKWLAWTTARSKAVSENEFRIHTVRRAHEYLRDVDDYDDNFRAFFRSEWGVYGWSDDASELDKQIKALALRGMPMGRAV